MLNQCYTCFREFRSREQLVLHMNNNKCKRSTLSKKEKGYEPPKYVSLTNVFPNFDTSCPDIPFNHTVDDFISNITSINREGERISVICIDYLLAGKKCNVDVKSDGRNINSEQKHVGV